ncbi:MAG: hypothetical protein R2788_19985 [Saprospiraceae bacterium]
MKILSRVIINFKDNDFLQSWYNTEREKKISESITELNKKISSVEKHVGNILESLVDKILEIEKFKKSK